MIIHPPVRTVRTTQIASEGPTAQKMEEILLSARIEFERGPSASDTGQSDKSPRTKGDDQDLWFRFQSSDPELQISTDADPFVVALLLLAMKRGESIRVMGSLSRQLWEGLQKYQQHYHQWYPEVFKIIEILPESLRDDPPSVTTQSACAFSGGVDSFYTFFELLKKREVTHTVFMGGFDMPLNLKASIAELTTSYSKMMKDLGIHFVTGSTNVRKFVNTVDWTNAHGQALIATALFFKGGWSRFFIPSSYTSSSYPKWGTHPALDPLLSTKALQILHHGAEGTRVTKLAKIAEHPESFDRLRVCWIQDIGLKNCGACEKCIRTQIALQILGQLNSFTTFQKRLMLRTIRGLPQRTYQGRLFAGELMKEALRRGKIGIWICLGYSLLRRKILYSKQRSAESLRASEEETLLSGLLQALLPWRTKR